MTKASHGNEFVIKQYKGSETSHSLKSHRNEAMNYPIGEIEVRPGDQSHISLGTFSNNRPPVGFSTHLTPDPQDDAIVTHVARIEVGNNRFELILHIANYGDRTISAEVRQL